MVTDISVGRSDDLAFVDKFLDAVGAPAGDSGDGKHRCKQLHRESEHGVNKAAVEVDICTERFEQLPVLLGLLDGQTFDPVIEFKLTGQPLAFGELAGIFFKDHASWIGECINGMTDTIDESLLVEDFLVQDLLQIIAEFLFVLPVGNIFLDVLKHLLDLHVGTAVLGTLEGTQGCSDGGIGIRTGGGNDMGREGGVVAAAVLCMQDQGNIQNLGLKFSILSVRTKQAENVFCS